LIAAARTNPPPTPSAPKLTPVTAHAQTNLATTTSKTPATVEVARTTPPRVVVTNKVVEAPPPPPKTNDVEVAQVPGDLVVRAPEDLGGARSTDSAATNKAETNGTKRTLLARLNPFTNRSKSPSSPGGDPAAAEAAERALDKSTEEAKIPRY